MAREVTNNEDIIDSRDVIARIEELEETREALREEFDAMPENVGVDFDNWVRHQVGFLSEDAAELRALQALAEEAEGYASDWSFGESLIRDSYFKEYAQDLAEELGITPVAAWPNSCVDWDQAARELQQDYTSVEFGGVTYWIR